MKTTKEILAYISDVQEGKVRTMANNEGGYATWQELDNLKTFIKEEVGIDMRKEIMSFTLEPETVNYLRSRKKEGFNMSAIVDRAIAKIMTEKEKQHAAKKPFIQF